jgi:hypothetical protein
MGRPNNMSGVPGSRMGLTTGAFAGGGNIGEVTKFAFASHIAKNLK